MDDSYISKENSFFQSAVNIKKLGAYYTDVEHARRIGYLFDFEQADEICVLEPSAGDGKAVLAVTGKVDEGRNNIRLFLVELDQNVYVDKLLKHQEFDYVLNADFLNDVKISNSKFSFSFANWPYGTSIEEKRRFETMFLEKSTRYLCNDGYLVSVVPYAALKDDEFLRKLLSHYDVCGLWRFDDSEYVKYRQLVFVAKKKFSTGYRTSDMDELVMRIGNLEEIPYLPKSKMEVPNHERFVVKASYEKDIVYFTQSKFNPSQYIQELSKSALFKTPSIANRMFVQPYSSSHELHPIMPLTKDMSYLCAIQGEGEGITGSEENGDIHLQRGTVKVTKTCEFVGEGTSRKIVEKTSSKMHQIIIENSGKITELA